VTGGVRRTFTLYHQATFTFGARCFNLTNHVQFGGIGTSLASPTSLGEISEQENSARDWQFSGALHF
jgi:hypothetical protein